MSNDPGTCFMKGASKHPSVDRISAGWFKGVGCSARYAVVSPKVIKQLLKSGFHTPRVLSKRFALFKPSDIDVGIKQAGLAFADSQSSRGQE